MSTRPSEMVVPAPEQRRARMPDVFLALYLGLSAVLSVAWVVVLVVLTLSLVSAVF